ncbi:hypothetical protein ACIBCT_35655 [Streptosporangium sp. NPDC050855]|uniref:hypothetical protein n=1 Tax=Streptosporangium sp. NPDC050855 TaxID=3366194 RepID=UPI0037974303
MPNFNPASFTAYSLNYLKIHVTWDPPTGEFARFRLVKNRWGYPVSEIDGEILLDSDTPQTSYTDSDVLPGTFHYYSAFIKLGGQWMWAATASCLHVADHQSAAWLWSRLPIHYQIMRGNRLDLEADTNTTLRRYMSLIGWGLDKVRTSYAAAWRSQDPGYAHIGAIDLLIQQFGLPAYPGLSGARKRSFVRDAASLLARRGTMEAMIAEARAASGWDLALRPSPNLMLTADRSQMLNPRPREWDPTIIYKVGDRVTIEGADYVCKVAGSTGYAQMPAAGDRVANTWWDVLLVLDAATSAYDATSRSQHGWAPQSFTGTVAETLVATELVLGAPKPLESHLSVNAVTVKNNAASTTANIGARLLPEAAGQTVKPLTAITHGIPLPKPQPWSATADYPSGSLVTYQGRLYTAVRPGRLGIAPASSDRWQVVGTDTRLRLTLSAYTHQPHTATAKPVNPAQVYAEFYDERGAFLGREFGVATDTRVLDTFTAYTDNAITPLTGRTTEYGNKAWTTPATASAFRRDSYLYGVARPSNPDAARSMALIDYGAANATVAATLGANAPTGKVQALVLRAASETSYIRASRTKLQTVNGAAITDLVTYSTPLSDGDRLTVRATGTALTVLRNGVQVATTTSTFNQTQTRFGMTVETP